MALIVQKFGGSSVKDRDRIFNVARIVANTHNAGNDVVVVVSAQGDTTDDLITKAAEITHNPSAREIDMLLAAGEEISIALSGHHHNYVIARVVGVCHNACHVEDTVTVLHRRTAELLYDQRHILSLSSFCPLIKRGTPGGSSRQNLALPYPIYHSTVAPVLSASKRSNVNASHPSRPSRSSRPFSSLE